MCDYWYNADGTFSKLKDIITPTPTIDIKGCECNKREQFTNVNSNLSSYLSAGNSITGNNIAVSGNRSMAINQSYPVSSKMDVNSVSHSVEPRLDAEKISRILKVLSAELKKVTKSNITAAHVKTSLVELISSISSRLINNVNQTHDEEVYTIANKLSLLLDHMNDSVEFSSKKMKEITKHLNDHTTDISNHYTTQMDKMSTVANHIYNITGLPTYTTNSLMKY